MRVPLRLRRAVLPLAIALVLCAVGCEARTDVDVAVDRDGSGTVSATVTLDREAAAQIPNLAAQLRVTDLRRAGWRLTAPIRTADGGLRVSASKRFGRAEQAGRVFEELAGRNGPFRGLVVTRSHSFARTSWAVRGTVDLRRGLAAFSDQRVTALLGGEPIGRSEGALRLLAKGSVADAAPFRVRVHLPGGVVRTYAVRLGDRPLPIDSSSSVTNSKAHRLAVAAAVAFAAAVILLGLRGRRRRKPPRSERGMGTYERRRHQPITDVEHGPAPGTGGAPTLIQVHRPPAPRPEPPGDARRS